MMSGSDFWKVNSMKDLEEILENQIEEGKEDNINKHLFMGVMMNNKQINSLSNKFDRFMYSLGIPMFGILITIIGLMWQIRA